MPSSRKTLLKNSFLYVGLGFLPLATNVLLVPIYSEFISPNEFGLVAIAAIFQGFLAVFIGLGLDGGFSRIYFDYYKKIRLVRALMSTTLLAIIASGVVFWIILYFSGDFIFKNALRNEQFTFSKYGDLVFFTTFSAAIQAVFLTYYRNNERVWAYSLVSLSFFFASVTGIMIGMIYFKAEAMGNIAGRAAGTTIVSLVLLINYFVKNGVQFKAEYLKASLVYSLPLMPYLFLLMAYNNIDKVMIELNFDLETLGFYNFAFLLASVISVLIYAIFNAISPQIFKLLSKADSSSDIEVKNINVAFHLIILGIITLMIAFITPVLNVFISEVYRSIQDYISLLILVYVFQVYYMIYTTPLFFHNKTKSLPWISLIVLITGVISNAVFIPLFGIYGVCIALFLTKFTQFLVAYLFVRYYKYNKCDYLSLTKNHIVSVLVIFPFGMVFALNYMHPFLQPYLINLIPLIIFISAVAFFFRKDILSVQRVLKRVFA